MVNELDYIKIRNLNGKMITKSKAGQSTGKKKYWEQMRDKELPYLVSEEFLPVNKKENPEGKRRHEPATASQRKAPPTPCSASPRWKES